MRTKDRIPDCSVSTCLLQTSSFCPSSPSSFFLFTSFLPSFTPPFRPSSLPSIAEEYHCTCVVSVVDMVHEVGVGVGWVFSDVW